MSGINPKYIKIDLEESLYQLSILIFYTSEIFNLPE